jgi:hypothetical protein
MREGRAASIQRSHTCRHHLQGESCRAQLDTYGASEPHKVATRASREKPEWVNGQSGHAPPPSRPTPLSTTAPL